MLQNITQFPITTNKKRYVTQETTFVLTPVDSLVVQEVGYKPTFNLKMLFLCYSMSKLVAVVLSWMYSYRCSHCIEDFV